MENNFIHIHKSPAMCIPRYKTFSNSPEFSRAQREVGVERAYHSNHNYVPKYAIQTNSLKSRRSKDTEVTMIRSRLSQQGGTKTWNGALSLDMFGYEK